MQPVSGTLAYSETDTVKSFVLNETSIIRAITLGIPNWTTGSPTLTVTVEDPDGAVLYTSAAQNENGMRSLTGLTVPCDRGFLLKGTLSGQPGGSGDVAVKVYLSDC
jgi:hypothetical protein